MKFYFTYGSEGQPFVGGWTEIEADNMKTAAAAFRAFHPDKTPKVLNCADMYNEEQFARTSMARDGNFGARCWERITLTREMA